jgi:hypothetical protein
MSDLDKINAKLRERREKVLESKRRWYHANKSKQVAWREKNRQRVRETWTAWAAKNPERIKSYRAGYWRKWWEANKEKARAHHKVFLAIKNGTLLQEPCVVCGNEKSNAHHENYDAPLSVIWLCEIHHKERH